MILSRDEIENMGTSVFKRVTNPKAMYVTLFQRLWLITLCAFVGAIIGLISIKAATRKFESHGKILVIPKVTKFIDESTKQPDAKAYDSFFPSHLSLIGSPKIIRQAVENKNLWELPVLDSLISDDKTPIDYIKNHLQVTRAGSGDSKGAFVIQVGFNHSDAQESKLVVDGVLDAYKSYLEKSMLDDQDKAVQLVEKMRDSLDKDVKARGKAYRDFIANSPGIWDRETLANHHQTQIAALQTELKQLRLSLVRVETRIEIMDQDIEPVSGRKLSDFDRLSLIDQMHIPRLNILLNVNAETQKNAYPVRQEIANTRYNDLAELKTQRQKLAGNLGPDHPNLIDLDKEIAAMESLLAHADTKNLAEPKVSPAEIVGAYQVLLQKDRTDLLSRIAHVEGDVETENKAALHLLDVSIQADAYRDEYERSRELYATTLEQVRKQSLVSEFGGFVAEIIERPQKGELTWPKKPVLLGLWTMLGVFTGIFIAIGFDLLAFTPIRPLRRFVPKRIRRFLMRITKRFVPRGIRGGVIKWLMENVERQKKFPAA